MQWSVSNFNETVSMLTKCWGGSIISSRDGETAIKIGSAVMLISDKHCDRVADHGQYPYLHCCHGDQCPHGDSVFNICLEVEDVAGTVTRMVEHGARVLVPVHTLETDMDSVTTALVTSPCDNVVHSLVHTTKYQAIVKQ